MTDIDRMIAELKAVGWTPKTSVIWKAPNGALFLGPAGAWRRMKGLASVADQRDIATGRQRLINQAIKLRAEIEQIFTDCASWNENVRRPDEEPINCDPDGQLRRIAAGLDGMLEREAAPQSRTTDGGERPLACSRLEGNTRNADHRERPTGGEGT